jgi:hypothetical protein
LRGINEFDKGRVYVLTEGGRLQIKVGFESKKSSALDPCSQTLQTDCYSRCFIETFDTLNTAIKNDWRSEDDEQGQVSQKISELKFEAVVII